IFSLFAPRPPPSALFPYTTLFRSVFRPAAVGRRAEARVAPRPGPLRRRIDLRVVERFLVADERSTRRDAVEAWLPARLPEHLVRSEEHTSELQSLAYLVCRLLLEK